MARKLPDPLERRETLYGRARQTTNMLDLGERYLEADRRTDAIECFERVDDAGQRKARLGQLRGEAIAAGDAFLLQRLHNSVPLDEADWRKALDAARAQGKPRYALKIAKRLGDQALIDAFESELGLRAPEPPAAPAAQAGHDHDHDHDHGEA